MLFMEIIDDFSNVRTKHKKNLWLKDIIFGCSSLPKLPSWTREGHIVFVLH